MSKINIDCSYDDMVSTSKLKPHPKNNNIHPSDQIERLCKIIAFQGFRQAIVVSTLSGCIVKGHGRLIAAKRLKMAKVPVNYQSYEDESQEYADLTADNEIARWAELDMESILNNAHLLGGIDLDILGIKDLEIPDLDELIIKDTEHHDNIVKNEENGIEDEVPEIDDSEVITKPGDIWILGEHRLLCGDSTKETDVLKVMNEAKADLIITDPPYNVAYEGKTKDKLTIQNDSMGDKSFFDFLFAVYSNLYEITNDGCGIYVFHADSEGANFRSAMTSVGWKLSQCCVWVKNCMVMGRQDYHWQHEPVLVGWKPTASHNWYADRKQTTVWNFNRPSRSSEHPTMKPIDLICYPMENSSKVGDIVVDLFLGSGSTLIAAEKLKRKCYGLELDPKYCDVIVKRWQEYTGMTAVNIINESSIIE